MRSIGGTADVVYVLCCAAWPCVSARAVPRLQACIKKQANVEVPCPYCDKDFKKADLDAHVRKCPVRRAKGIKAPRGLYVRRV